jgi:hypothetical protein
VHVCAPSILEHEVSVIEGLRPDIQKHKPKVLWRYALLSSGASSGIQQHCWRDLIDGSVRSQEVTKSKGVAEEVPMLI